ncbi:MAG: imidazoleglycerol-phosphate dehydratase HisB [Myxococcota bacterium]
MRRGEINRKTGETDIRCSVQLDGEGKADIKTGIGFLDHMLGALAKHSRIDITLSCTGDLEVDDHHTAEDCALALGGAIDAALGERRGIYRFGDAHAPLDEALARAVVDLAGRPSPHVALGLRRDSIGDISSESLTHVLMSLGTAMRAALHVDVLKGENDHHKVEAAFKATALALRHAVAHDGSTQVPSTKGVL